MGWMVPPALTIFALLTRPPWAFSVKSSQLLALSIQRCPRIASAGFLSVLIEPFDLDPRLAAHGRDCLFHDPTNDLGKSPYRLRDRTTVVIMPSTSTARLSEQSNSSPSVTCTGVKPRPASDQNARDHDATMQTT